MNERARHEALLGLEIPFGTHLDDPVVEWRRLFGEWLGTFLLVLTAAGGDVVDAVAPGGVPFAARVVAPGVIVMSVIYATGAVGGAHLNPAVTLCFATRGNFPWVRVPGYVLMQLLGSVTACGALRLLFGDVAGVGATTPLGIVTDAEALAMEILLTLGLATIILGTASGAKNVGANAAIAVGGYVAAAGLWAAPISGASMNPARSLGPNLVSESFSGWWIYVVGPIVGAQLAVAAAWALRGPPTAAGTRAAQGDLA